MSSIIGGLAGVAEKSAGEAVAFGLGFALGRALEPAGVGLSQTAWDLDPNKVLEPHDAANIVAERLSELAWGEGEARQTGINAERFDRLVNEVLEAPGFAQLLTMLRRGTIQMDDFLHGLGKHKLEPRWDTPLEDLKSERVPPEDIARGIQRGLWTDPGILPVGPPSAEGKVRAFPVVGLDPLVEAAASGFDKERLAALVGLIGLPASNDQAARAFFRGIIESADYFRAVAEGNTRNEWGEAILEVAREILTANQYTELELRGFSTRDERVADTAKHGMSPEDSDKLYNVLGRAPSIHTVVVGLARGGKYPGSYANVPEPFRSEIQRSNIREEWAEVVYAARFNYPSGFQIRAEARAGDIPQPEVEQLLHEIGWSPEWAKFFSEKWTGTTPGKGDTHVSKAETQVWTALHKSYVDNLSTDAETTADLAALGVAEASQPEVLKLWQLEREIVRRSLTPAQIKKAIGEPGKDQAWATTRLLALGYSAEDAATFLAE